jgi:hypothetical protein
LPQPSALWSSTPFITRPYTLYNVSGTGSITLNSGAVDNVAITYNTAGDPIGSVPSGSALYVELIDPL